MLQPAAERGWRLGSPERHLRLEQLCNLRIGYLVQCLLDRGHPVASCAPLRGDKGTLAFHEDERPQIYYNRVAEQHRRASRRV